MAVYLGVDLHVRTKTVCWADTADGEEHELTLDHEPDEVRAFYSQFPTATVVTWKLLVTPSGFTA